MGRITVAAKIENVKDALDVRAGTLPPERLRSVEVSDALVDTGAKLLSMPTSMIHKLGLERLETRQARTSVGLVPCNIYSAVWLTVQGRRCTVDVAEVADECPVLIGYYPLELLDLVVDPAREKLIPDPQQGGQQVLDLF